MPFTGAACTGTPSTWHIAWQYALFQHSWWYSILTSLQEATSFLSLCDYCVVGLVSVSIMKKDIIIHLPFIVIPLIIARVCLIGQCHHRVGSKPFLLCGQPLIIYVCWCSYQLFLGLCLQCECDRIAIPLCIDLVKTCLICWHCIGVCMELYAVATVITLGYHWWPLPWMVCGLQSHWLPWQSNSDKTSPDHVLSQGYLTLYCYTPTQYWINSCSQMQLGSMLCCSEPLLIHSSCHLLPVRGQPLG